MLSRLREWWDENVVAWYGKDVWVEEDTVRVHWIKEEYGASVDVGIAWAHEYRHRDTGNLRRRVAYEVAGSPTNVSKSPNHVKAEKMSWVKGFGGEFETHPRDAWLDFEGPEDNTVVIE